jgi:hypothetical protein
MELTFILLFTRCPNLLIPFSFSVWPILKSGIEKDDGYISWTSLQDDLLLLIKRIFQREDERRVILNQYTDLLVWIFSF